MMHSQARLAPLPFLSLLLASPAAASFFFRPEVVFLPSKQTDLAGIQQALPIDALPTPPPVYRRAGDVAKGGGETTLTVEPNTCGFNEGLVDNAFQCVDGTRSCTDDGTYVGCCDVGSTCEGVFFTTCINFEGFESGLCDAKGSRTFCCTELLRGNCKTLTMLDSLTGIACGSEPGPGTILLDPTDYDGPITTVSSTTRPTTTIPTGGVLGSGQTKESPSKSIPTIIDANPKDDGEEPRPSNGAIIGGVVGAVVVFAIVICGAVWFVRRKKDLDDEDSSPPPPHLPYCIPEAAQTPSEYGYPPYGAHYYSRSSVPSSVPSSARSDLSTIEQDYAPTHSGTNPNITTRP